MVDKVYTCSICNYSTKRQDNYLRHTSSKRHLKKVGEGNNNLDVLHPKTSQNIPKHPKFEIEEEIKSSYVCKYCNMSCARASSLNKHLKICSSGIIEKYKQENSELKDFIKEQKNQFLRDIEFYKSLIKEAGVGTNITNNTTTNTQNNMSVQSLIISKHSNAPALEMATSDILELQLESDNIDENAELILYYYRRKAIAAFIGDGIVSTYRKENPDDQSLWATDVSRLTMFIKKLMNGNESVWIPDKKGIKTREYLIDPLLDKVDEIMEAYVKDKHAYIKMKREIYPKLDDDLEYMNLAAKLSNEIRHKKYHEEILRYIAPRFSYNKENLEQSRD